MTSQSFDGTGFKADIVGTSADNYQESVADFDFEMIRIDDPVKPKVKWTWWERRKCKKYVREFIFPDKFTRATDRAWFMWNKNKGKMAKSRVRFGSWRMFPYPWTREDG